MSLSTRISDLATRIAVEIKSHLNDTTNAHSASAITNTPAGGIAATTVQAAINELDTEKATTGSVSTVQTSLDDHIAGGPPGGAHAASVISFVPTGAIAATNVQAAIGELDTEKQPLNTDLTAIAALTSAADKAPYSTGAGTWALADQTSQARTLAALTNAGDFRGNIFAQRAIVSGVSNQGIGTAAKTSIISGYTPSVGDLLALTMTNGNTATSPTLNINSLGAVSLSTSSPVAYYEAVAGAVWFLYYTGSVWLLLNNADPIDQLHQNQITSGQEIYARELITGEAVMVSQRLSLSYFTSEKVTTISSIRTATGATAAGTPTTCKVGLFLVNADNSLTLQAKSANTTSMWASANTHYLTSLDSSVSLIRGQRYAMACLFVGTTPPTLLGQNMLSGSIFTYAPRLSGDFTGKTDIETNLVAATGNTSNRPWGALIP